MDMKTRTEIVLAAQKIIFEQEGNYGSVNADDNGAVSVGKAQWHAGRALALLKKICAEESRAASILGAALYQEITTAAASAWNARTVSTAEKAAIGKLLSTDAGKRVQDAQAEADVGAYVDHGLKMGVKDPAALIYFADLENQGGGGASARVAASAKKPVTLDAMHAAGLADRVMGKYSTRRKNVYNAAKAAVTGGTKMNRKPVSYLQTDPRWKNKPYRVKGESATIGSAGCGPTAAAMLLSTLTGKSITPEDTCKWSVDHGYKALGNGTYYAYFAPQFAAYGIKCWQLNWVNAYHNTKATSFDETVKYLKQGYYAIALMKKGTWTGGGHFVVMWWADDKVRINDPASTGDNRVNGNLATFKNEAAYFWIVDAREYNNSGKLVDGTVAEIKPEKVPQAAPGVTAERKATGTAKSCDKKLAGTYAVTAGSGLHIRNVAGSKTGSMVVLPCGTKVQNYGYYTEVNGVKWLYIQVTYQGVKYTGFSSGAYLKKA
jgi:hypothetical protein